MTRVRVVALALCLFGVLGAVAPALAAAGSISGTVTAATGGLPVGGIRVCARIEPFTIDETCADTDSAGAYSVPGLPAGSYRVRFSELQNRNLVDQYFDGESEYGLADLVTIGASENRTGVDAALRPGGTIAGTVTDAGSGGPVGNFLVCAFATTPSSEVGGCWRTDSDGNYAINGLLPEDYVVEFLSQDEFNYLPQLYDGVEKPGSGTPVPVAAANEVKSGIDAALLPGVELSGTVIAAGSGGPLPGIEVALLRPVTADVLGLVRSDSAGHYAFRGRPSGSYVVGFSHTQPGSVGDCYSDQYYKGAGSFAAATPLTLTAPSLVPGVDGELSNLCPETRPQPVQVTFRPADPPPAKLRCKKNQRKRWVKGKYRCVKKPKRHRHHHRHGKGGHGPRAVATDR